MKKKIFVLALALAMIFSFAACGGGSDSGDSSSDAAETAETAAEPNAGVDGIVYVIPDGWELTNMSSDGYREYSNPNSIFHLNIDATTAEEIATYEGETAKTVQEYFEKYYSSDEERDKKNHIETETRTICDSDALYYKRNENGGILYVGCAWVYDDHLYSMSLNNYEAYDDDGNIKEDAAPLSDEELALFDALLASVQPGDGSAFQVSLDADSLGALSFTVPEGFAVDNVGDTYVNMVSTSNDQLHLSINIMSDDDLQNMTDENGKAPSSMEEFFNERKEYAEPLEIAGQEGFWDKYPEEDGNYYSIMASTLIDGQIYDISIDTNAYDENGLKADAVPLTDEEMAAFDSFVASLKLK